MSICILIILIIWHAAVGVLIFETIPSGQIKTVGPIVRLDRYVCWGAIGTYVCIHVILLTWLYCVPLKRRRELKEKDVYFRRLISRKRDLPKNKPTKSSDREPVLISMDNSV
jgi:hypothetical protein